MKTILITGSHGQLGRALIDLYQDNNEIKLITTDVDEMNIVDEAATIKFVSEASPDVIINCAAYTNVEKSETDRETVMNINVKGVENLCKAALNVDAVLFHISSDYVFDGKSTVPYLESDKRNPHSFYGESKYEGEVAIEKLMKKYYIVRTAWLYGEGHNFVNTMLKLAETKAEINVVSDQVGSPTSAEEVAKVIDLLKDSDKYGIYHASCEGSCSWCDFSKKIFELAGKDVTVHPTLTKDYPSNVDRPLYSVLENRKLLDNFGYKMAPWEDAVSKYIMDKSKNGGL